MMSKFEMALLTVTVIGTLVAWPALQQDSFVRPADGTMGMARRRARSARSGIADAVGSQAVTASSGCVHRLATPLTPHPRAGTVAFRRDIVRNTHEQ